MSDRQLRDTARIDYQVLHSTGETVILDQLPRIPRQAESSDESSSSGLSDSGSDGSLNRTIVANEPEIERISQNLERISLTEMDLIKLQSLEETLYDDITDYVEENPSNELLVIEDINCCVAKLEDLR